MKKEEWRDIRSLICNACNNQFPEEPCEPEECEILCALKLALDTRYVPVPKKMQKAVRCASNHYEEAIKGDYVRDPVAWALYHAWRDVERNKV